MVVMVVPPVSPGLSEAASVVAPVSCVGGRGGDGGVAGFKRGLMVAVVVLLLVITFVRVKPVAPLLAENGCFLGETARQWCHWLHASAAWCCRWCRWFLSRGQWW